jgi:hypothetical protein
MSGRRIFTVVVIAVLVLAILAAGGNALFRLGYANGASAAAGVPEAGRLNCLQGGPFMPGLGWDGMHEFGRGGGLLFRSHMPIMGFGVGGWLFGLLLLAGVVALVVIAVNGLRSKGHAELPPMPSQPAEAPAAQAPARTPRGGKKAR